MKPSSVKDLLFSLFSAVLLILSFPSFNLWIFAWVGFVPLFLAIRNKSKPQAFLLSYLTGIIFWTGVIYWLIHVTLIGLILLVLYLALYFGFFGLVVSRHEIRDTGYGILFIPSIWVLLEYIRSHLFTGFPWALLGYSQYLNLSVIQIADITGAWGVSFLVMMVNVTIYSVLRRPSSVVRWKYYILYIFCLFGVLGYGYYRVNGIRHTAYGIRTKISVIQGNIPQQLKWDVGSRDFIMDKYLTLTRDALRDSPDLIIWPEAALPAVLEEEPRFFAEVKAFVSAIKIPLLLGAVTSSDSSYYNSALLISSSGEILTKYNKLHLVPFGEYIPLRKTFRFLETVVPIGDFTPGREYTIFQIPESKSLTNFALLICFEDLFSGLSRSFVKKGADFLVNITNDAWFGKTSSSYQHLQASVFRAVENRVNLVRAANTGISGFIAPSGKIISLVKDEAGENIFIEGYNEQEIIIPARRLSFYNRWGDVFVAACFLFLLYGMIRRL